MPQNKLKNLKLET